MAVKCQSRLLQLAVGNAHVTFYYTLDSGPEALDHSNSLEDRLVEVYHRSGFDVLGYSFLPMVLTTYLAPNAILYTLVCALVMDIDNAASSFMSLWAVARVRDFLWQRGCLTRERTFRTSGEQVSNTL